MKRSLFHRWIIHSALAATLALALVPTLGRLVGPGPVPAHHVSLNAAELPHSPSAGGGTHHGSGDDCAYCPLLLGTSSLPVPRLHIPLPLRSASVAISEIRTRLLDRHPTGLGSRGPPLAG